MKNEPMTKKRLEEYIRLCKEIAMLDEQIYNAQMNGKEFVWDIVTNDTVPMVISGYGSSSIPKLCERRDKRKAECAAVEAFIDTVEDSTMRQILARRYIEDRSLEETALLIGYSKGHISRLVNDFFSETC